METTIHDESWETLIEVVTAHDERAVVEILPTVSDKDIGLVISRLSEQDRTWLLSLLDPEESADLLQSVTSPQAAEMLVDMSPTEAGRIVEELPTKQAVEVLGELRAPDVEDILQTIPDDSAVPVRQSLSYTKNTAGNIMVHEVLAYPGDFYISDIRRDLQKQQDLYRSYHVLYIYVVDRDNCLIGVMKIHDLLFAPGSTQVKDIMIENPHRIPVTMGLDKMSDMFNQFRLLALPVVDENDRLTGIVLPHAVEEAKRKRTMKQLLWVSGFIGGEEYRSMPLYKRSGKRLSWLTLNIALNIVAASVIALYQETLAAVIALAVFLPMVSDMSGCSGNQAVAVSLRELSLGILRPGEILRVAFKESSLGILNGLVLGILLGVVAFIWKGNFILSLVIGSALAGNTIVAVTFGGILPLVLKKLKIDPALVSSPLLTTVTDMCGFFLVLSFASLALPYLSV